MSKNIHSCTSETGALLNCQTRRIHAGLSESNINLHLELIYACFWWRCLRHASRGCRRKKLAIAKDGVQCAPLQGALQTHKCAGCARSTGLTELAHSLDAPLTLQHGTNVQSMGLWGSARCLSAKDLWSKVASFSAFSIVWLVGFLLVNLDVRLVGACKLWTLAEPTPRMKTSLLPFLNSDDLSTGKKKNSN